MARFNKMQVLDAIVSTGMVPVYYNKDVEIAKQVVKACYEGGVRAFEFTNRGDFAHEVFAELIKFATKECPEPVSYTHLDVYKRQHIYNTDEVYFILSMATSFNGFDKSPSRDGIDPSAKAASILEKALSYDYQTLKQRHTEDYLSLIHIYNITIKDAFSEIEKQTGMSVDYDESVINRCV